MSFGFVNYLWNVWQIFAGADAFISLKPVSIN
jgi:hypothetical protein